MDKFRLKLLCLHAFQVITFSLNIHRHDCSLGSLVCIWKWSVAQHYSCCACGTDTDKEGVGEILKVKLSEWPANDTRAASSLSHLEPWSRSTPGAHWLSSPFSCEWFAGLRTFSTDLIRPRRRLFTGQRASTDSCECIHFADTGMQVHLLFKEWLPGKQVLRKSRGA